MTERGHADARRTAPDKFKGSLTAAEVAAALAAGLLDVLPGPETIKLPVADGGDGTVVAALSAGFHKIMIGPSARPASQCRPVRAERRWAAVELAAVVGLSMLPGSDSSRWDHRRAASPSQRLDGGPKSWPRRCTKVTTAPMSTSSAGRCGSQSGCVPGPRRWSGCGGSRPTTTRRTCLPATTTSGQRERCSSPESDRVALVTCSPSPRTSRGTFGP
jgi:hypothetical protein